MNEDLKQSSQKLRNVAGFNLLNDRAMSGFPVSVGTGLSLETVFDPVQDVIDPERKVPNKVNISQYNLFIINVSTLLRNLLNSLPSGGLLTIDRKDILDTLLDEISFIDNYCSLNGVVVKFYINTYLSIKKTYEGKDKLRIPTTDKQRFTEEVINYCLDKLYKEDEITVFPNEIVYNHRETALIMTHVPYDLLSHRHFSKLDLLESHTGVVKTKKDWNTKYYPLPNKDMSFLPFVEGFLVVFGDHVMFKPDSIQKREELYNALKAKKVHPLMSEETIRLMYKI